jgi:UPF0755 protein
MKRNRRSASIGLPVVLILLLLCGLISGGFWILMSLPESAAREFGAPGGELSLSRQLINAVQLYMNQTNLQEPLVPGAGERNFAIEMGESLPSVAQRLENEGFIRSAEAFQIYVAYRGWDKTIQAGKYQISPAQSAMEIALTFQDATPHDVPFVILPGWRLEEIAEALPTSGLTIDPQDFLDAARQKRTLHLQSGIVKTSSLEGYILPGSYVLGRDITLNQLLEGFIQRFDQVMTPELINTFQNKGLSIPQAVTLASIVQREAVIADEKPLIASVFHNRLQAGMKLDSDPTVQYAVGYNQAQKTWWTNPLSVDDLGINSPYNTYLVTGLPPTPICAPDEQSLNAVAFPEISEYYYFQAACDGSGWHQFTRTYEEHLQNLCQ